MRKPESNTAPWDASPFDMTGDDTPARGRCQSFHERRRV
jgi:hypothetical protein